MGHAEQPGSKWNGRGQPSPDVIVRAVDSLFEFEACEELQRRVWGYADIDVIPTNELVNIQKNGGLVLGAFERGGGLVGFVFGFTGYRERKVFHCSRMVAVLDEFRGRGVACRLKTAQAEEIMKRGIDLITWTVDPLEAANAALNFRKLGVVANEYEVNLYGQSTSFLHEGLDTDRLVVRWHTTSGRVTARLQGSYRTPAVAEILTEPSTGVALAAGEHAGERGEESDLRLALELTQPKILLAIPEDIQALKARNLQAARDWRRKSREAFIHYFRRGYAATGFLSDGKAEKRRNFYILEQGPINLR
jgi:predicted GNAT superfamily acetyltransferase